jgi:hypothetical protein
VERSRYLVFSEKAIQVLPIVPLSGVKPLTFNELRMNSTIQMEEERSGSIVPYICWVIVLVFGFYDLVYVREVFISMMVVVGIGSKILNLVDKVGFFFFAASGLLIILLTEPYFRIGWRKRLLQFRFWKIVSIELASLSVLWAILLALPGLAEQARPALGPFSLLAAALVVSSTLCLRAPQRASSQPS